MNPHTIIADRVLASLPSDIDTRRAVLSALVAVLPRSSDRRPVAVQLLTALNTHLQLQTEFDHAFANALLSDRPVRRAR
jgi:hypothetical protein